MLYSIAVVHGMMSERVTLYSVFRGPRSYIYPCCIYMCRAAVVVVVVVARNIYETRVYYHLSLLLHAPIAFPHVGGTPYVDDMITEQLGT